MRHGEFLIAVDELEDGKAKVTITPDKDDVDDDFYFWMCACEYLLHLTAQKSRAGYEKALELLCKGAMTYKSYAHKT